MIFRWQLTLNSNLNLPKISYFAWNQKWKMGRLLLADTPFYYFQSREKLRTLFFSNCLALEHSNTFKDFFKQLQDNFCWSRHCRQQKTIQLSNSYTGKTHTIGIIFGNWHTQANQERVKWGQIVTQFQQLHWQLVTYKMILL